MPKQLLSPVSGESNADAALKAVQALKASPTAENVGKTIATLNNLKSKESNPGTYRLISNIVAGLEKISKEDAKALSAKAYRLAQNAEGAFNALAGKAAETGRNIAKNGPPKSGFMGQEKSSEFASMLSSDVQQNSINPSMFYGVRRDDAIPTWANEITSAYSKDMAGEAAARIQEDPLLSSKPKLQSLLYEAVSKDCPKEMLMQLTLSQKVIDGVSLMLKARCLGANVSEDDLRQFFGRDFLPDDDFKKVLLFARGGKADANEVLDMVFNSLQARLSLPGDVARKATSLVIDSNFGENASALKVLIEGMGGTYLPDNGTVANGIENLKAFYKCLADESTGLSSDANRKLFSQLGSTLTTSLLGDRLYLSSSPQSVQRDKYDISLLAAFTYAAKNSPDGYFRQDVFKQQQDSFLSIIGGAGNVSIPAAVPLTIVQNFGTIDALHENFLQNEQGFYDIMTALFLRVNSIYALPLESRFNTDKYPSVKSRFDAANTLVQEMKSLQGNALLDYMIGTFADTTFSEDQNVIKLRNPFQLILAGSQQTDMNNVRNFLKSMNINPTSYFDTQGQYKNWLEFARRQAPGVDMASPQEIRYNLLRKLPQTYTYGIDKIYGDLVSTKEYFRPAQVGGSGNLDWQKDATDVPNASGGMDNSTKYLSVKGNTSLDVSGPVGSIINTFKGNTVRSMNLGTDSATSTGSDQIYNSSITQAKDIYTREAQINDAFISWLEAKGDQVVAENISNTASYTNDLNFRLRGIALGAGFVLMGERYFDKDSWKLRLEAVINTGKGYVRIANLDKFQNDPEFQKINRQIAAHLKYVEHSQWSLPVGTYAAFEKQDRNVQAGYPNVPQFNEDGTMKRLPGQRHAFMIGAGNVSGDKRLAGLSIQTASGSMAHLGSYGSFNSDMPSTVVTAGYLLYRDETNIYGQSANNRYNSQGVASSSVAGTEFLPDKPMAVLSGLSGKFYGLALGNMGKTGTAGAQIGYGNTWGLGGIMRYDGGPRSYMLNGQYFSSGFAAATYVQGEKDASQTASAALKFKLNKDWNLKIYGLASTSATQRLGTFGNVSSVQKNALLNGVSSFVEDFSKQVQDPASDWNAMPDQRNALLRGWTAQMMGYLDQATAFLPSQAVDDLKSQFAIGIEKPGEQEYKLAIVKLKAPGSTDWSGSQNEHGYLVTMDRIRLGKSVLSLTAGLPAPVQSDVSLGDGKVSNFAGLRFDVGKMTFGATGTDIGTPGNQQKMRFDVVHIDDDWAKGVSLTLLGQGGHRESLMMGNRNMQLSLGNTNVKGLSSYDIASSLMLSARLNAGAYFRSSSQQAPEGESLHMRELGLNWTYNAIEDAQFGGQFFVTRGSGAYGTSVTNGGARLNFRLRLP